MKQLWTLAFSVVLLAARPLTQSDVDNLYAEGQKFFTDRSFESALANFEQVAAAVPNDSRIDSWIAACLNELGRYAEAKDRLEAVIQELQDAQRRATVKGQPPEPIDVGYFTLLARVHANLREFERAVETLAAFAYEDDGSEAAGATRQALDTARKLLKTQFAGFGLECLRAGDLACARRAFTQADVVQPATPPMREWAARDFLSRALQAPGASDADKASKIALHQAAIQASRLWLEEAGADTAAAQRVLAESLLGTKTKEGYEEALQLMTALTQDPAQVDSSMQFDLATAYTGLEQWGMALVAATKSIELDPDDELGRGYCLRSFAQFQLGRCPEAMTDGKSCKNSDGSPRQLRHVEVCQQRQSRQDAERAAALEATRKRKCNTLYARILWARGLLDRISLEDLVDVAVQFKASEVSCRAEFDEGERAETGAKFSSPLPEMCAAGARLASTPLNLASRPREALEALRGTTETFLKVCTTSLDSTQVAGVNGALGRVGQFLQ